MKARKGGTLDWFVSKKTKTHDALSSSLIDDSTQVPSKEKEIQFDVNSLPHDLGLRTSILDYHPNVQDERDKSNENGGDAFIRNGFKGWNIPNGFDKHVGRVNSIHNQAREKYESLMKPKTSIQRVFKHQSVKVKKIYEVRLLASLHCLRYLLHQVLATRGHNEGQQSSNKGNFLELLEWLAAHNEDIDKVALKNAPKNHRLTGSSIQRDLIRSCAEETSQAIIRDLGEDYFAILVDESFDISQKEQMSMLEAYYIHCFAHQLQLTLVAVSKKSVYCGCLFDNLTNLLNVIGVSCKRKDMMREIQAQKVKYAFDDEELESGKGLHQELGLGRPGDTRWGSHYKLILNVIALYPIIRDVLDKIGDMSSSSDHDKLKADVVTFALESFDFVFMAHLMKTIFDVANELNVSLQKKDQDIINAMSYVKSTKEQLQKMRDHGWQTLLSSVISFCEKNDIEVPNMEDLYVPHGRKRRGQQHITNDHHFRVEVFYMIVDLQLQELNARFDEVSTNLLVCMANLSPLDAFISFDKQKLLKLAEFYPQEFSSIELLALDHQLDTYIHEMKNDGRFLGLMTIGKLSMKLVESNKHKSFGLVYLLIKLVLILPVATTSVERSFSTMTFVKNKLRNSLSDQMLNDSLVTFIEKDVFFKISDDVIVNHFQKLQDRRGEL